MPLLTLAGSFGSALLAVVCEWVAIALIVTPSLAYMAEVTSFAGGDSYGVGYGVYNAAWAVGLLTGPALGGLMFERLGFSRLMFTWAPAVILESMVFCESPNPKA